MPPLNDTPHIVPPCHDEIEILFEDDYLLLINKPEPLLSTPGRLPENKDSAISRLQQSYPSAELVHRLDMATSGIMVIPLSKRVNSLLAKQFQQREIEKTYTAILYGKLEEEQGEIDIPIITDWKNRPLQKVCYEQGKPSVTHYEMIEYIDTLNASRVIFKPITGRSHQLRIHSREIGHPILGCNLYKNEFSQQMADRLMLHATSLSFIHPITGAKITQLSPCPF